MKTLTALSLTFLLAGVAFAGDPKAGAPAPAADKKAAPPADKKAPDAPPPMAPPKAPQELADMAKQMAGSWKCTGQAMAGPTGMADTKGSITHKLDLDKWWIQSNLSATIGKESFKFTSFTSYDATAKKWHRLGVNNLGGEQSEESAGMTDGKIVWEGSGRMMGMTPKIRDTEEMAKDGKSVHVTGEMSTDGGKTWTKGHDVTCKK